MDSFALGSTWWSSRYHQRFNYGRSRRVSEKFEQSTT